jgi:hypothetical protein
MKKISLLICFFAIVVSIKAAEPYNYNQNYNFNKFIKEGKWVGWADRFDKSEMTLTKESTGKKDMEGNEVFNLHFKSEKHDAYLVPDNDFYPLFYRLMIKSDDKKGYILDNCGGAGLRDHGFIVLNENHIACVIINEEAGPIENDPSKHLRIGVSILNYDPIMKKMEKAQMMVSPYSFIRGKGYGAPYKNWVELMEAEGMKEYYSSSTYSATPMTQWKGIPKYYEYFTKYQEQQLELAKTKKLNSLLNEFADGEYKLYTESSYYGKIDYGKIKIKFEKTNGKVTGFTVQNCFTDGLYYDKEKFIVKHTVGPNGKVSFDGGSFNFYIVPFDGRLLIYYGMDNGMSSIMGVISPNQQDVIASYLNDGKLWSVDETDHSYFCKTEMEMEYNEKLDKLKFYNYIQLYHKTILGK